MKKILLISISIISFLFLVGSVKAETLNYNYSDNYSSYSLTYDFFIDKGYEDIVKHLVDLTYQKYLNDYSSEYPYY